MKRPLLAIGISFATAVWAFFLFPGLPALPLSALFVLAGLAVHALRPNARAVSVVLLAVALALAHSFLYRQRNMLPLERAVGQTVVVQGVVLESRQMNPGYALTVQALFPDASLPKTTLRLRGYGEMEYLPGDGIHCLARLEELPGSRGYYHSKGIFVNARLLESTPHTQLSWRQMAVQRILILRHKMTGNLYDNLSPATAGVVSAMVLGEWEGVAPQDRNALAQAGTIHLLSVSGLHLSILVGCVTSLLGALKLGQRMVALVGMVVSAGFAFLVGLSPSITRALVMMLLMLGAKLIARRSDSLNSMGLALFLIALFAPYWTLGQGLWLSCASTAGIVLFSKPLYQTLEGFCFAGSSGAPKVAGYFLGVAAVSMGAYAFSFPILLAGTGWISLLTPLANVLVAPLSAPALVCGMLCALFPSLPPAAFITNLCINWILSISRLIASIPLFTFSLDEFWKVLWLLLGAAVTALLFRWRADKALRRYGAALLVLAFSLGSITLSFAQRHEVELVALENCSPLVLIRGEKAVVVGTPSPYEIRTLSRYLEFRGVEQLDALIAADCGEQIHSGLLTVVRDFSPGLVAGPDDDYILSMLERALPGQTVLSTGYARIQVLGDVFMEAAPVTGAVLIQAGHHFILHSGEKYAIITQEQPASSGQLSHGTSPALGDLQKVLSAKTGQTPPAFEPVGSFLFGERRFILKL
jgi:competence protein ComEC